MAHAVGEVNRYLHQDRLGSVTAVTNYQGQVEETYRYDAFGAPMIKGPSGTPLAESRINNRFLFTGREYNKFGFYEYRARAYDPKLGRFMSEDPMSFAAGDTNLFRYCGGDPVNHVDPSGLAAPDDGTLLYRPNDPFHPSIFPGEWKTPDGFPVDLGGQGEGRARGSGPDATNQGGGGGGGLSMGWVGYAVVDRVWVTPYGSFLQTHVVDNFGFRPGDVSTGANSSWAPFYRFLNAPATPAQKAWTDKGRVPTLLATTAVGVGMLAPPAAVLAAGTQVAVASGRVAASWSAYQIYLHPWTVFWGGTALNSFISPNTGTPPGIFQTGWQGMSAEVFGWGANQWVNDYTENTFGP